MRSRQIQKRLLAEKSLTWKTAVEMALAMEVAVKQTNNFRNSPADSGIHYVRSPHPLKATKPNRVSVAARTTSRKSADLKKNYVGIVSQKGISPKFVRRKHLILWWLRPWITFESRWEKTTSSVRGGRHPSKRAKRRLQTISHSSGKA